jgi:peptidoglycan-associated lipoprotein
MRFARSRTALLTTVAAIALLTAACAKQPMLTAASAPAPVPVAPPTPAPAPPPPAVTPPPPPVVTAPPPAPAPAPAPVAAPVPRPAPKEFMANDALKPIHFDFDKAVIRPVDTDVLNASATWLREHPSYILLIEGHCDERGTPAYNLALGERRANAAMSYLTSQGVRADRISTVSFGEERPICTDNGEGCWKQNRRAQFLVKEQ